MHTGLFELSGFPVLSHAGEVKSVENTPFDLRAPALIGSRLKELPGPGFDHNFCLWEPGQPHEERWCARYVFIYSLSLTSLTALRLAQHPGANSLCHLSGEPQPYTHAKENICYRPSFLAGWCILRVGVSWR